MTIKRRELRRPAKTKPFRVRVDEESEKRYLRAFVKWRGADRQRTLSDAIREAMDQWEGRVMSSEPPGQPHPAP